MLQVLATQLVLFTPATRFILTLGRETFYLSSGAHGRGSKWLVSGYAKGGFRRVKCYRYGLFEIDSGCMRYVPPEK